MLNVKCGFSIKKTKSKKMIKKNAPKIFDKQTKLEIEEYNNCFTISDKARCIAGSVLEICVRHF